MKSKVKVIVGCVLIAIAFLIGSFIPFLNPESSSDSQPARISTITGTPYPGSGDWNTGGNPVIYDGTDLTVYGTITTGAGGLTIKNCKLTIDLATPDEHYILVNQGFFRAINAVVTASNTTAGKTDSSISAAENSHIYLSNSTIEHFNVQPYASGDYIDNNTMDSSIISYPVPSNVKNRLNVSYNDFINVAQGYVMYGFPTNSVITGNTVHDTCVQEYSGGTNGWINVFGNGGLSDGSSVIKNYIEANCAYQGITFYDSTDVYVAFNTIDTVERTWNISDHPGKMCAGIYLIGDGTDSLVTRNIVRRVDAWEALNGSHVWGNTGVNIGIAGKYDAIYWQITYNQIWFVGGAGPTTCYGINYQGSHANIDHNNMTWVGVEQGPYSGSNPAGIIVEGDYNGIFGAQDSNHHDYVNSTWNTISTVYAATNGITYGWGATVNDYVRNCWISNNTIGTVIYNSGGIGIYIHARYIHVLDNHVTDVKHDSYGLGMGQDVIYSTMSRNYVHVTDPGGYSPADIANNLYFGAFCSGDEGYATTLQYCVISYNHMTIDTRVIDGVTYPEYAMMGLNDNDGASRPIFIVTEPSLFSYANSTFQIMATFGSSNAAQYTMNGSTIDSNRSGDFYIYDQILPDTWAVLINVTSTYEQTVANLISLTLMMFALGVVVGPMAWVVKLTKLKKPPTIDQLVHVIIFIIVGLAAVGVTYSII